MAVQSCSPDDNPLMDETERPLPLSDPGDSGEDDPDNNNNDDNDNTNDDIPMNSGIRISIGSSVLPPLFETFYSSVFQGIRW